MGGRGERDVTEETLSGVGGVVVEQLDGSGEGGGGEGRGGGGGGESEKLRARQTQMENCTVTRHVFRVV